MAAIRHDLFPCYATVFPVEHETPNEELRSAPPTPGGANFTIARVVVTSERVIIALDGSSGPKIVYDEAIDPATHFRADKPRDKDSFVTTINGQKVVYKKDTACGCGSRLKSWNPAGAIVNSIKDPTE